VIFLNAGRISLLAQAQDEGRRVVLVTDELCCLTPAFAEVWREAGAAWVVRSVNGLREGFTGRWLSEIGEVFTAPRIRSVDDVDLGFLRPAPATAVQVMAVISLRHKARATTILGGPMAEVAKIISGAAPQGMGSARAGWQQVESRGSHWLCSVANAWSRASGRRRNELSLNPDGAAYERWDRGDH
jgi:hypothetical protein